MKKVKSIHFMGIKGVGMAPLAIIAKEAGISVTGSDISDEFITDASLKKAGITPFVGFSSDHVRNVDLVIATSAHDGFNNVEVEQARKLNIPVITQGQAVGEFMKGDILGRKFEGISVTGTHGKTTTTAMLATVLLKAGLDPSYTIGTSDVPSLFNCGHLGRGHYFVAEADEYMSEPYFDKTIKFLWQHPKIAVFTNIEFDHPDIYKDVDDVRNAFLKFARQLPKDGMLIACGDDYQTKKLLSEYEGAVTTYGFSPANDYVITKVTLSGLHFFRVENKGVLLGEFSLQVFGEHNVLNATASIVATLECGVPLEMIKKGLSVFTGSKRRTEYRGKLDSGAQVFDDYAHHPTEIRATLKTLRQQFPKNKIVSIFQPHMYSRTKELFEDFVTSFSQADIVIISNIYPSLREKPDPEVSSELLTEKMSQNHKEVVFLPTLPDVVKYIEEKSFGPDTVVITMGAGDIYKLIDQLNLKKL